MPPTPTSSPSAIVTDLTERAAGWTNVTLVPQRSRAVAFVLEEATVGVLHPDGLLEIPVPAPIRSVLVEEGFAARHTARPTADWVATRLESQDDVMAAALLLRLSYLYRRLLRSQDAPALRRIRIEVAEYDLPDTLQSIYDVMLDKRGLVSPPSRGRSGA